MDDRIKMIADHYGYESQSRQLVEEMAELTQGINKEWRMKKGFLNDANYDAAIDKIVEEIADTEIMLEQVKYLLGIEGETEDWIERKLERTLKKIKPEKMVTVIGGVHGIHYGKEYKTYYWRADKLAEDNGEFRPGDLAVVHTKYGLEYILVTKVKEVPEREAAKYDKAITKAVFDDEQ